MVLFIRQALRFLELRSRDCYKGNSARDVSDLLNRLPARAPKLAEFQLFRSHQLPGEGTLFRYRHGLLETSCIFIFYVGGNIEGKIERLMVRKQGDRRLTSLDKGNTLVNYTVRVSRGLPCTPVWQIWISSVVSWERVHLTASNAVDHIFPWKILVHSFATDSNLWFK